MGKREERGVPVELFYWSQIHDLLRKVEDEYMAAGTSFMEFKKDTELTDPSIYERIALREYSKACAVAKLSTRIHEIFYPEVNKNE